MFDSAFTSVPVPVLTSVQGSSEGSSVVGAGGVPRRRVVVTGFGAVTPLGLDIQSSWQALLEGKSGIDTITSFDAKDFSVHIAGEVKNFNPDLFIPKKEQKKMDVFMHYALASAQEAMEMAGLSAEKLQNSSDIDLERAGSIVGVGIGGLPRIERQYRIYMERGPSRFSTFIIPMVITNLVPGHLSLLYGLKGPSYAVSSACASGAHAIGESAKYIRDGTCDLMITGGAESAICPTALGGFSAMRALSRNEEPQKASRPFDAHRDGFVLAEGAAILILEEYQHALKRKAPILGEVVGYAVSSDAHHITQPDPEGKGALQAMKGALRDARLEASDLDYINAHGTSTPIGDRVESQAIEKILGHEGKSKTLVNSTKGATGHMLGAAGAVESLFCLLSLKEKKIPPTLNLEEPGEGCSLNYVRQEVKEVPLRYAMNNSFGFGGTNACLIFSSV